MFCLLSDKMSKEKMSNDKIYTFKQARIWDFFMGGHIAVEFAADF